MKNTYKSQQDVKIDLKSQIESGLKTKVIYNPYKDCNFEFHGNDNYIIECGEILGMEDLQTELGRS